MPNRMIRMQILKPMFSVIVRHEACLKVLFFLLTFILVIPDANAKRVAPKGVMPVVTSAAVYSAPHFLFEKGKAPIRGGIVEAREPGSEKILWRVQVYQTKYDDQLETDVQDVFIKSLSFDALHEILVISDEASRLFVLDAKNKKVTQIR